MEHLDDINQFCGHDAHVAKEVFDRFHRRIERFLRSYLANYIARPEDRDDVMMSVLERLWRNRREFQFQTVAAWWALVAKIARNCAIDQIRDPETRIPTADPTDLDQITISGTCHLIEDRELIYRAADEVWLGVDRGMSDRERKRRLLAAQLFYLHRQPWQEICELLGHFEPFTRSTLDEWLSSPTAKLELAFIHLYRDNDSLCGYLLSPDSPLTARELAELANAADDTASERLPHGWGRDEVQVVMWRFRNGLSAEKILQMHPGLTPQLVNETVTRCVARMPFQGASKDLVDRFDDSKSAKSPLRTPNLWKRLVFQYYASDDLPQKHMLERTEPAAKVAGYELNPGVLNAWLSSGRLIRQLLTHTKVGS